MASPTAAEQSRGGATIGKIALPELEKRGYDSMMAFNDAMTSLDTLK